MCDSISNLFDEAELGDANFMGDTSPDEIFSLLESLEGASEISPLTPLEETVVSPKGGNGSSSCEDARLVSQKSVTSSSVHQQDTETEAEASPARKRPKLSAASSSSEEPPQDGQQRMSHITVERNRRKQMNEHLSVLRSLMPCFYVKRVNNLLSCNPSPWI
uniref:BHLH domain-containing protein n=1 Tax=Nelumbo nucifera TaxID=4432 RepID=A0A822XFJ7_NELNU|nr:TPA_asm: hypothetical protein HUJ06_020623 [Nelumbo nucifera]